MEDTTIEKEIQNPQEEEKKQLTEEQVQQMRENMIKYYDDQIPMLKKQLEYESLIADIEEARFKKLAMQVRIAEMMAPPMPEDQIPQEEMERMKEDLLTQNSSQSKKRTLKRQ